MVGDSVDSMWAQNLQIQLFTLILNLCWKPAVSYLGQDTIENPYDSGTPLFLRKLTV